MQKLLATSDASLLVLVLVEQHLGQVAQQLGQGAGASAIHCTINQLRH